jgi:hypothetical protein
MNENGREGAEQIQRQAGEPHAVPPLTSCQPRTLAYTDLPDGRADSPITNEWNFYRREVGDLLANGHENRWVLIKGQEIIGIWDTEEDARAVALQKYLMQPCLIQQVRSREPVVHLSARFWGCQG